MSPLFTIDHTRRRRHQSARGSLPSAALPPTDKLPHRHVKISRKHKQRQVHLQRDKNSPRESHLLIPPHQLNKQDLDLLIRLVPISASLDTASRPDVPSTPGTRHPHDKVPSGNRPPAVQYVVKPVRNSIPASPPFRGRRNTRGGSERAPATVAMAR